MSKKGGEASVGPTFVENISVLCVTTRMAPLGLQMYAADFLSGAKAIQPSNVQFAPARPYLACHALELALKAFLALKGYSLDKLAGGKFSHDLANLLDEAKRCGLDEFVKLEEAEASQIRRASNYYSVKVFEYPAVGEALSSYPWSPDTKILISAAETLVSILREPCLNAG